MRLRLVVFCLLGLSSGNNGTKRAALWTAGSIEAMVARMKIASWNVNSIKARLPNVLEWLQDAGPDVVALQELKCQDEAFPRVEIADLGYNISVAGQKGYNGVAILSKYPMEVELTHLPGDETDQQARYIEVLIGVFRICGLYLPNGNPVDTVKYSYKLAWMDRLIKRAKELMSLEESFVMLGDYNVIPHAEDCWDESAWADDALYRLDTRKKYRTLLNLGLTDAFRALHSAPHQYSFWDYQKGRWSRDEGIRIDHILLSPTVCDMLTTCEIDRKPRAQTKASDHTPIICTLTPPD